jgi:hypothetical protein
MQNPQRVPTGGTVKSAEGGIANFSGREAVCIQGKISTHLLHWHAGTRQDLHRQGCEYAARKTEGQDFLGRHKTPAIRNDYRN